MTGGSRLRQRRPALVVVAVVGLLVVLSVLLRPAQDRSTEALAPDNPGLEGAQAVARVLARHEVEVRVVRGAQALEAVTMDAGTTVLVTSAAELGASTVSRLRAHQGAARLVVVEPPPLVLAAFDLDVSAVPDRPAGPLPAACDAPLLAGLRVDLDRVTRYRGDGAGCFGSDDGSAWLDLGAGVGLLGAGGVLANDTITRGDNAAVALRLLAERPRLVWYLPDAADLVAGDDVPLSALLPRGLVPALWLVGAAALSLVLWRGRRLGPLVVEPLPVHVKDIETTRSRGRLYRRARDRAHAAAILRLATADRLAAVLGLPRGHVPPAHLLAHESDRSRDEVALLLSGPAPTTDDDLIRLAQQLAELEREVAHRP